MRYLINLLLVIAAACSLAGCFNPELGATPFKCALTGTPCPEGYDCHPKTKVCVAQWAIDAGISDVLPVIGDGAFLMSKDGPIMLDGAIVLPSDKCTDNSLEPNNSGETATEAKVGYSVDWTICYPGDVDQFFLDLKANQSVTIKVKFNHANGDLDAALLNPAGELIMASRSTDNIETLTIASVPADGRYVFAVYGFSGATNRFDLEVTVQ